MRKILFFITCLVLIIIGSACSKDDKANSKLILSHNFSNNNIEIDRTLVFRVKSGNERISDAKIYKDNEELKNYTFKATTEGEFEFVAKKKGYKDSSPIKITVTSPPKNLYLSADKTECKVGEIIKFTVREGRKREIITDAEILSNNGEPVNNNEFKATKTGNYFFTAKKDGTITSSLLKITVKNNPDLKKILYDGETRTINDSEITVFNNKQKDKFDIVNIGTKENPIDATVWEFNIYDNKKNNYIIAHIGIPTKKEDNKTIIIYPGDSDAKYTLLKDKINKAVFDGQVIIDSNNLTGFKLTINSITSPQPNDYTPLNIDYSIEFKKGEGRKDSVLAKYNGVYRLKTTKN